MPGQHVFRRKQEARSILRSRVAATTQDCQEPMSGWVAMSALIITETLEWLRRCFASLQSPLSVFHYLWRVPVISMPGLSISVDLRSCHE